MPSTDCVCPGFGRSSVADGVFLVFVAWVLSALPCPGQDVTMVMWQTTFWTAVPVFSSWNNGLQLGLLCREPISSYRSALSIPAISSSSSSSSTFPTYALSSLRLNPGLPYVTYLCSSFSRTRRHGHNESFIQRSSHEPKRHIAKVINLDKKAWKSSGGTRDQHKRSLRLVAKANDSTADEPLPSEMSLENALKLLGVGEGASFEEILRAKKVMVDKSDGDQEQITQVSFSWGCVRTSTWCVLGMLEVSASIPCSVERPVKFLCKVFLQSLPKVGWNRMVMLRGRHCNFVVKAALKLGVVVLYLD